jgi:predicted DNA-binding transcriptional regulator YafY
MRALSKLEQVLPVRLRSRVRALQTHTVLVPRRHRSVDPDVLTMLASGCRDHVGLRFDYEDRRGSASQRRVEPHRVVHAEGRWYLVAWDTDRDDWRTFRVDRIRSEVVAGHRVAPRELSDDEIAALLSRGVPPAARRYMARVTVLAPAAAIADRIGPWVGTLEPIDGSTSVLETGADDLDILAVHLGMLNVDFIVTEPPELVAHLHALGERYARSVRRPSVERQREYPQGDSNP